MGHINREHGRIAIETKSGVGFIIHAGYGYRPRRGRLRDVRPGQKFKKLGSSDSDRTYQVEAHKAHVATVRQLESGWEGDWSLSADVEVLDDEEFDGTLPLAGEWVGSHPEFLAEDIDDLIAALQEAKERL